MAIASNWNLVDVFTLNQASALWCGIDPATLLAFDVNMPSEVMATKQLFFTAIKLGQLTPFLPKTETAVAADFSNTLLGRGDLKKFAEAKGVSPAFLFDTIAPFESSKPFAQTAASQLANRKVAARKAGGRPPEYDWDSFALEIIHRANSIDGLPDTQAELVRDMLAWFRTKYDTEPAESSVKARISKIYRYLEEARNREP